MDLLFTGGDYDRDFIKAGGIDLPEIGVWYAVKMYVGLTAPENVIKSWKRSRSYLRKYKLS